MVTKISTAVAIALIAFLAAPIDSFAATKNKQSSQRGPYTPDIVQPAHGPSNDFQGGSRYYKRSKTKKNSSSSASKNN
jgi:hypothetical protein